VEDFTLLLAHEDNPNTIRITIEIKMFIGFKGLIDFKLKNTSGFYLNNFVDG
jgi:hypothetical protein